MTWKRNIEIALRLLLALLFIFSGCAKSIDCVGTSLYVASHLDALHLSAFAVIAKPLAALLGATELSVGLFLLLNIIPRATRFVAMSMMVIFTLVTLLNLTLLPLEDCGCFGDVVTLSTEATFLKNILLLPASILLWMWRPAQRNKSVGNIAIVGVIVAGSLAINIYTLRHLPLVDLLPYSVGQNLRESVKSERETIARSTRTELIFINLDNGEECRFAADCVDCWLDDNLEYVGVESVTDGKLDIYYDDFIILDDMGVDRAEELLSKHGDYVWLCIASSDEVAQWGGLQRIISEVQQTYSEHELVVLSAVAIRDDIGDVTMYGVDSSTLRSILRADVGVIVLRDGVIEEKLNIRDL